MSLGDILGQLMQQGMGGQGGQNPRLQNAANRLGGAQGGGGGGLDAIFSQIQGALGGAGMGGAGQGGGGGFADRATDFIKRDQVGGLSGGQIGGIGALAGALLGGGGIGGAAKGGAMAILGTLALSALKNAQAKRSGEAMPAAIEPQEVRAVTAPENEQLMLTAMISAAKADGTIDQGEMQKIIGKISQDDVSAEERQFVLNQMAAPLDLEALAAQVTSPAQAAQVYAASLLAITPDSEAERSYLVALAAALGLDKETVAQLHQMTGSQAA